MKPKVIKWGKNNEKSIVINRDFFNMILGVLLVLSCALLSGILQLVEAKFDFSVVSSSAFWVGYILKLATGYMCLFGTYILRKLKNKQTPKFLVQREKLKEFKREIVERRQISAVRSWLKNVYNYSKKVERYQDIILTRYEHVYMEKPEEPKEEDYDRPRAYIRAKKRYTKALKRYKKADAQKKYLEGQLKVCEVHFKIIEAYKKNDLEKAKALTESIKETDDIKLCKIKIKPVTYNSLFNFELAKDQEQDSIYYNEKKLLAKRLFPTMLLGVIFITILSSIIPGYKQPTTGLVLMIILNLLIMGWYVFSGINLANNYILKIVFTADQNRIFICEQFKEDYESLGHEWYPEPEEDEREIEEQEPSET